MLQYVHGQAIDTGNSRGQGLLGLDHGVLPALQG
jgi:hypothetical protein